MADVSNLRDYCESNVDCRIYGRSDHPTATAGATRTIYRPGAPAFRPTGYANRSNAVRIRSSARHRKAWSDGWHATGAVLVVNVCLDADDGGLDCGGHADTACHS